MTYFFIHNYYNDYGDRMKEYVFLRINEKFNCLFYDNLPAFLELYNRKEESVFYKEQFRLFLEKNKMKDIIIKRREWYYVCKGNSRIWG